MARKRRPGIDDQLNPTESPGARLSRRGFLGVSASAAAALGLGCSGEDDGSPGTGGAPGAGGGSGGGGSGGASSGGAASGGAPTGGTSTGGSATGGGGAGGTGSGNTALVGLARHSDIGQAVREAIALTATGLSFIRSGDTVLLKPNLNSGDPSPYSTSPEVVRAVIELVRDFGASRVIVADRSNPSYDTIDAMQRSGIYAVAQELQAETINLADVETVRVTPAGATHWSSGFTTYRLVAEEVDHVINLPACKHHGLANFTMALKAWMGIVEQDDRNTAHQDLGNRLPEFHLAVRESFVVLDATKAALTRGPNPGGEQSSPGIVVATADPVASDATGVAILKYELARLGIANRQLDDYGVWDQPQLVRALAIGLGIGQPSEYAALASGVEEFDELLAIIEA